MSLRHRRSSSTAASGTSAPAAADEGQPASRTAALLDLTLLLAALVATTLIAWALGAPIWVALVLGGCAGAASTRVGLGARVTEPAEARSSPPRSRG